MKHVHVTVIFHGSVTNYGKAILGEHITESLMKAGEMDRNINQRKELQEIIEMLEKEYEDLNENT